MEREVEGAKVGELKRGVTAPGMNGMNMRPCQALPPLCEALPQLVADKHWESNQVSTRPSRASLTVIILRYEIEKGLGAVQTCPQLPSRSFSFNSATNRFKRSTEFLRSITVDILSQNITVSWHIISINHRQLAYIPIFLHNSLWVDCF